MTADIITFPVAKQPPTEGPLRGEDLLRYILRASIYWKDQGLGPEDLPEDLLVNMDTHSRRLIELLLGGSKRPD